MLRPWRSAAIDDLASGRGPAVRRRRSPHRAGAHRRRVLRRGRRVQPRGLLAVRGRGVGRRVRDRVPPARQHLRPADRRSPCSLPATQPVAVYERRGRRRRRSRWCSRDAPSTSSRSGTCTRRPAGVRCCTASTSTVRSGEVHVIMGPNGSGKSTLAHALMGRPGTEVTAGSHHHGRQELSGLPGVAAGPRRAVPGPAEPGGGARGGPATSCWRAAASAGRRGRGRRSADRMVDEAKAVGLDRSLLRAAPQRRPVGRREQADRDGPARRAPTGRLRPRRDRLGPRRRRAGRGGPPAAAGHHRVGRRAFWPSRTSTDSWSQLEADLVHVLVDGRIVATGDADAGPASSSRPGYAGYQDAR